MIPATGLRTTKRRTASLSRLATILLLALVFTIGAAALPTGSPAGPTAGALVLDLRHEVAGSDIAPDVRTFYAARLYQPLWMTSSPWSARSSSYAPGPEARWLINNLADPESRTKLSSLWASAQGNGSRAQAKLEIALSQALASYARDMRAVSAGARLSFVDADLAYPQTDRSVLEQASTAPSLGTYLASLTATNPIYQTLNVAAAEYRATWSALPQVQVPDGADLGRGDTGERVRLLRRRLGLPASVNSYDASLEQVVQRFQAAHGLIVNGWVDQPTLKALNTSVRSYERLIEINLQRARALPPPRSDRFLLVNVAAQELWFYEHGRQVASMRVAVGTRRHETPMMAGIIRYLVFNPYWNVPVDIVRDNLAHKVQAEGPDYFSRGGYEALSDWSDDAVTLNPAHINWAAVSKGAQELRVRQRPGGANMMGTVKFMFPNELGIYLHDTPSKAIFDSAQRLVTAGCVRLEAAPYLAQWLLGDWRGDFATPKPDQRVNLHPGIPVYITYLTVAPKAAGLNFYPDVYARDAVLLAQRP